MQILTTSLSTSDSVNVPNSGKYNQKIQICTIKSKSSFLRTDSNRQKTKVFTDILPEQSKNK